MGDIMKRLFNRLFNKSVITDAVMTPDELATWLKEPMPGDAATVLAWHNKNIPANDF